MRMATRIKGLKRLQTRLKAMASDAIVQSAIKQTRDELKNHQPSPSLPFIYHVFREKLRDTLRNTSNKR